jgi:hypothetical protein
MPSPSTGDDDNDGDADADGDHDHGPEPDRVRRSGPDGHSPDPDPDDRSTSGPRDGGSRTGGPTRGDYFRRGVAVVERQPLLAVVPFLVSVMSVGRIRRAATADTTVQVPFGLPAPVSGLWTFLNAPTRAGVSAFGLAGLAVRSRLGVLATVVAVATVLSTLVGLATAVYLGAIDDDLAGRRSDHLVNLRRHAPVTLTFAGVQLLGTIGVVAGVLAVAESNPGAGTGGTGASPEATGVAGLGPLVLAGVLVAVVCLYVLTPGVYAGVAADLRPRAAFGRGVELALSGGHLVFALAHALTVAVVSVPLSALGYAAGLGSLLVAAALAAPVGVIFNAATMAFVRDRVATGEGRAAIG